MFTFEAFVGKALLDFLGVVGVFRGHLLRFRVGVASPLFLWFFVALLLV